MKTNPASKVPAMAPIAPEANIAPSAGPLRGAVSTAICARTGAGTPAKKDGRKKTASVNPVMPQTGLLSSARTGPASGHCARPRMATRGPTSRRRSGA